jgi:anti-sigma B factor antagonist
MVAVLMQVDELPDDDNEVRFDGTVERLPGNAVRVMLRGDLDLATAPMLETLLASAVTRSSGEVDVDLSAVRFCDASGVNVLVRSWTRLRDCGRRLRLFGVPPQLAKTIEITETTQLLA